MLEPDLLGDYCGDALAKDVGDYRDDMGLTPPPAELSVARKHQFMRGPVLDLDPTVILLRLEWELHRNPFQKCPPRDIKPPEKVHSHTGYAVPDPVDTHGSGLSTVDVRGCRDCLGDLHLVHHPVPQEVAPPVDVPRAGNP